MDTSEPSTNGTSASNLYRLSSLLNDSGYEVKARQTIACFESEILQYPWLFASFMPGIVAGRLGVRGRVVFEGEGGEEGGVGGAGRPEGGEVGVGNGEGTAPMRGNEWVRMYERSPRGSLGTFARLSGEGGWLRGRNSLLKDFGGKEGRSRVLVCEGGVCREEDGDDKAVGAVKEDEDETVAPSTHLGILKDTEDKVSDSPLPVTTSDGSTEIQKSL